KQYLDYVALKGDTSDNIPGGRGGGERTAAKLVQDFGTVEELVEHIGDLKGKLRDGIDAARQQLPINKDLARIVTDVDLDVEPEDCVMGIPDRQQIQRVFVSLESRSLLDRLDEAIGPRRTAVEVAELDLQQVTPKQLARTLAKKGALAIRLHVEDATVVGVAVSGGDAKAAYSGIDDSLRAYLADPTRPKWTHDAKELERGAASMSQVVAGVVFDSMLAGYLLDPAGADY